MKKYTKKLFTLLITLAITIGLSITAFAEGSVTYKDDAEKFIFAPGSEYSPTDLFTDFKGVMPGDSLKQTIVVKNEKSENISHNLVYYSCSDFYIFSHIKRIFRKYKIFS